MCFTLIENPLSIFFANICPRAMYIRYATFINGFHILLHHLYPYGTIEHLTINSFRLNTVYYLTSKKHNLFYKFSSKFIKLHTLEVLEIIFVGKGSNHSTAFSFFEIHFEMLSDFIFRVLSFFLKSSF